MTLHLPAVMAGRHALDTLNAAQGLGGDIHSAYRRTINIRFPGDRLICLHGGRQLVAPFGIALGHRFGSPAFERIGPGLSALATDGLLRVPGAALEVSLAGAAVWTPAARPAAGSLPPATAARHAEILAAILRQHDEPGGMAGLADGVDATPLLRRARPLAEGLMESLAGRDPAHVAAAAEPLLGLGPGLTPSGDDFLAGFLGTAGLAAPWAASITAAAAPALLRLAESKTTLLSRSFLSHALQGVLAPPMDALAAAILGGAGREAVARAARGACALGHTSGMDTVTGMLFALRALAQVPS